jgi:hypothetical protein
MESGFGRDFGDVRLHTDSMAGQAARTLGAEAFTSGRDIYFGHGRYQPTTESGQRLLAHELTHTVQQTEMGQPLQRDLTVGSPEDVFEREADEIAEKVVGGGEKAKALSPAPRYLPLQLQDEAPAETAPPPAEGGPAEPGAAPTEPGEFVIKLGGGIRLKADELEDGARVTLDLSKKPATVPGLKLKTLRYYTRTQKGEIEADLNIPFASAVRGGVKVSVEKDGSTRLKGTAKLPVKIGALNDPELTLALDPTNNLSAELAITADKLKPPGLPKLSVEGGGNLYLKAGKLGGDVNASLVYQGLAKGQFNVNLKDGVPQGGGKIEVTQEYLKGVAADLQVKEGDVKADVAIPASKIAPPIPGLEIPEGTIHLIVHNRELSGSIDGLHLRYREFGEGTLSGTIRKDHVEGTGSFTLMIPAMDPVKGELGYRGGKLFGRVTLTHNKFPKSLPVRSGSITAGIDEKGSVDFDGTVAVDFYGVGSGELHGAYKKGNLDLGADVTLKVPGLQPITAKVDYINGKLEGEVDVPIESKRLAGISGNLHVEYRDERWKAEQKLNYSRDDGKVSGSVTVGLLQDEAGKLGIYGGGDVTAQLTSFLQGQLKVDILPEGTTKLYGAIVVTKPIELFPEKKGDRELFNVSRNIPLWAILVAVVRVRGGVRAGVGPGQLRDITVEGEYTIGGESQPSFVISGELFIPAYAEAYLAFGVGLGLDVVLGSLTGGIEAVGTAGVYGAVSVRPEIAYRDGNYSISGVATLAAAAKIKLGLQAWAEIEALWITVWERTWHLAEWVWNVGPTLALQASMEYTFGQPKPPSFEFKTSDIDAERLIQDAMPKEGPKGSGAREALKNRAQWKGPTKGKGAGADTVPSELAGKEKKAVAPKAPPKPPRRAKPPEKGAPPTRPVKEKGGKRTPELEKAIKSAAEKQLKDKEKDKKTLDQVPSFPRPSPAELEINWANYIRKTKGKGQDRSTFERRMHTGEVYHPGLGDWRDLKKDYIKEYPRMSDGESDPARFATKMRHGYMLASPMAKDAAFDATAKPPGTKENPYPIHWPTGFLVESFESFSVLLPTGRALNIPPQPRQSYYLREDGKEYRFDLGVGNQYAGRMAIGRKLQRRASERGNKQGQEWDKWRQLGFRGGAYSPEERNEPVTPGGTGDENMFRRKHWPGNPDETFDATFGTLIETDSRFVEYQRTERRADKDRIREAARGGKLDITNPDHVRAWREHFDAIFRERQPHVMGYQMQHVVPLFLIGASGDFSANLWPLDVGRHQGGHDVLASQPDLPGYGASTHHLESTELMDRWFIIDRYV